MQHAFPAGGTTGNQAQRFIGRNVGQQLSIGIKTLCRGYNEHFDHIPPPGKQGYCTLQDGYSTNMSEEFITGAKTAAGTGSRKYHTKTIVYHGSIVCPNHAVATICPHWRVEGGSYTSADGVVVFVVLADG